MAAKVQKTKNDLGQVFTPDHLALFAAKLLNITEEDVVLDSTAGSGSLLFAAIKMGCSHVVGIEYDENVFNNLDANLKESGVEYQIKNLSTASQEAYDFIKSLPITKAILNPPYEKENCCFEIITNTLNALTPGTKTAIILPQEHLRKNGEEWAEDFLLQNTIDAVIDLPDKTFIPFASVHTALYLVTAGIPQKETTALYCNIKEDGLQRAKRKYREDSKGLWANKYEPYWLKVINDKGGDASCGLFIPNKNQFKYSPPVQRPTEEDFMRTVDEYMTWKSQCILRNHGLTEGDAIIFTAMVKFPDEFNEQFGRGK